MNTNDLDKLFTQIDDRFIEEADPTIVSAKIEDSNAARSDSVSTDAAGKVVAFEKRVPTSRRTWQKVFPTLAAACLVLVIGLAAWRSGAIRPMSGKQANESSMPEDAAMQDAAQEAEKAQEEGKSRKTEGAREKAPVLDMGAGGSAPAMSVAPQNTSGKDTKPVEADGSGQSFGPKDTAAAVGEEADGAEEAVGFAADDQADWAMEEAAEAEAPDEEAAMEAVAEETETETEKETETETETKVRGKLGEIAEKVGHHAGAKVGIIGGAKFGTDTDQKPEE